MTMVNDSSYNFQTTQGDEKETSYNFQTDKSDYVFDFQNDTNITLDKLAADTETVEQATPKAPQQAATDKISHTFMNTDEESEGPPIEGYGMLYSDVEPPRNTGASRMSVHEFSAAIKDPFAHLAEDNASLSEDSEDDTARTTNDKESTHDAPPSSQGSVDNKKHFTLYPWPPQMQLQWKQTTFLSFNLLAVRMWFLYLTVWMLLCLVPCLFNLTLKLAEQSYIRWFFPLFSFFSALLVDHFVYFQLDVASSTFCPSFRISLSKMMNIGCKAFGRKSLGLKVGVQRANTILFLLELILIGQLMGGGSMETRFHHFYSVSMVALFAMFVMMESHWLWYIGRASLNIFQDMRASNKFADSKENETSFMEHFAEALRNRDLWQSWLLWCVATLMVLLSLVEGLQVSISFLADREILAMMVILLLMLLVRKTLTLGDSSIFIMAFWAFSISSLFGPRILFHMVNVSHSSCFEMGKIAPTQSYAANVGHRLFGHHDSSMYPETQIPMSGNTNISSMCSFDMDGTSLVDHAILASLSYQNVEPAQMKEVLEAWVSPDFDYKPRDSESEKPWHVGFDVFVSEEKNMAVLTVMGANSPQQLAYMLHFLAVKFMLHLSKQVLPLGDVFVSDDHLRWLTFTLTGFDLTTEHLSQFIEPLMTELNVQRAKNRRVVLSGYQLGGTMAEIVGLREGVDVFSFSSPTYPLQVNSELDRKRTERIVGVHSTSEWFRWMDSPMGTEHYIDCTNCDSIHQLVLNLAEQCKAYEERSLQFCPPSMQFETPPVELECPSAILPDPAQWQSTWSAPIYLLGMAYLFWMMSEVCEEYFVPALTTIIDVYKIPPNVAGATLMAAGTSSPELAAAIVGVFFCTENDVGVGTVVGSTMFNNLVIIGGAALISPEVITVHKWVIGRDAAFYLLSIILLYWSFSDGIVTALESGALCFAYVLYIIVNAFFADICAYLKIDLEDDEEETKETNNSDDGDQLMSSSVPSSDSFGAQGRVPRLKVLDFSSTIRVDDKPSREAKKRQDRMASSIHGKQVRMLERQSSTMMRAATGSRFSPTMQRNLIKEAQKQLRKQLEAQHEHSEEHVHVHSPFDLPEDKIEQRIHFCKFPALLVLWITISDCKQPHLKDSWPQTFCFAIVWLGLLVYFCLSWAEKVGCLLGTSPVWLGLTVCAVGTSLPDFLSSLFVAKDGLGMMAVCNAVGSNIFDICVGLGVPFLLQCLLYPDEVLEVEKDGLGTTVIGLLIVLFAYVWIMWYDDWKISRKTAKGFIAAYVIFFVLITITTIAPS